jgi:hypothetical protein
LPTCLAQPVELVLEIFEAKPRRTLANVHLERAWTRIDCFQQCTLCVIQAASLRQRIRKPAQDHCVMEYDLIAASAI